MELGGIKFTTLSSAKEIVYINILGEKCNLFSKIPTQILR